MELSGSQVPSKGGRRRIGGKWYHSKGGLRLQVRSLLLPSLIKQSFDQNTQAAEGNSAVLILIFSTIGHFSSKVQDEDDRRGCSRWCGWPRE
jgi:hypothetical protein